MKFSYNWLKEYIPGAPDAKKLAADLDMRVFEVEQIEKIGNDEVLDVKILPNRAFDCQSHLGLAREIAAIEKIKFKEPAIGLNENKSLKIKDLLSVQVLEPKLCLRYSARVVLDVKVGDSPQWLKDRLRACGLRPINNIVDITNFVMLECGQPLHAFDMDKLNAEETENKKIIVRRAGKDEKIITLDEGRAERILNENVLVIADEKQAIGIAGIKGGKGPEIDPKTRRVALEAANFDPVSIRKSSKALNLHTDASIRFENRLDMNLTVWALDRAAALMQELAGGQVAAGVIDITAAKQKPQTTGVTHGYIESLLGVRIKNAEVLDIFKRLGLVTKTIKKGKETFYEVLVPTRRGDLLTREDLIEEIGRLYGYENIRPEMSRSILLPALKEESLVYADKIKDIMAGLGYSEVYNYSFVGTGEKDSYNLQNLIEVRNSLSQEQKYLRPNLVSGLLANLRENLKNWHAAHLRGRALRLFEIGRVFEQRKEKAVEEKKIGGIVYLRSDDKNKAFFEMKGVIEILFNKLSLADIWEDGHLQEGLSSDWNSILNPQKTAQIKVGQEILGLAGEINPHILDELEADGQAVIFEIDFAKLVELISEECFYQPPSQFPAVVRDLSILVGADVKIEDVISAIENAAGKLLEDIDLFDLYEGEDLANEQKSLAFHLIWQSAERNLTDAEVNKLMGEIVAVVEEKGWEVRK